MSHAIQFLESVGRSPAISPLHSAYDASVSALQTGADVRLALLARDASALAQALGARPTMMCAICTPEDEDVSGDETPGSGH